MSYFAFVGGAITHVSYFNKGEHHLYGTTYIKIFLGAVSILSLLRYQSEQTFSGALRASFTLALSYIAGLYCSLVLYRLWLHPLKHFPGPWGAKISCLWFSAHLRKGDAFRKLQSLHDQHGDFLRIGSSDLSITHPQAVMEIYGPKSKCAKAAWYDLNYPLRSLQTYRSKTLHDQRRRVWSSAFGEKSLRAYEHRIQAYQRKLSEKISESNSNPINVTRLFNLFTFDIMGDLSFGKSFDMLDTNQEHWAIALLNAGLDILSWMFPVWLLRVLMAIPLALKDWWAFLAYCEQKLQDRRKAKVDIPDLMSTLLEDLEGREPSRDELDLLIGDAQLIIVAGSETTSSTLTYILYELARHPEQIRKLRNELTTQLSTSAQEVLNQDIVHLDHLNGVIFEALRLHPPVPSALPRLTPPEGIRIGDTFIPGNVTVWCPQYVIGRKEEIYSKANDFVPERWYLYPDMIKEKAAWAPFSYGAYGCIGKLLALLTLRTTIARLIMTYDISFPEDSSNVESIFSKGQKERFTLAPSNLDICFQKRSSKPGNETEFRSSTPDFIIACTG